MVRIKKYKKRDGTEVSSHDRRDASSDLPYSKKDYDPSMFERHQEPEREQSFSDMMKQIRDLKKRLDNTDKMIIHYLGHNGESGTNKVAEGLNISWATAQTHLKFLEKEGYVIETDRKGRSKWKLIPH